MIYRLIYTDSKLIKCETLKFQQAILSDEKSKIDQYKDEWDKVKKCINIFEYIYFSQNKNKNISDIIPISRSFFKLIEISKDLDIINKPDINCFCIAEAPGGFIQSLLDKKEVNKINAVTLISDNTEIPRWNNNILNNDKVILHKGINDNGDICDLKNVLSIINKIGKNSIDLITGDGGFDYSSDYNKQEINSLPLIYSEIFLALNVQKENGNFICKFFDLFFDRTIQLIYILSLCYNEVYIHKPSISRLSNSEKYIVCLDYKGYNKEIINLLIHTFNNPINFKIDVDFNFYNEIIEFNKKYTNNQIKQINKGIDLIKKYKNIKNYPSKYQIKKALEWCNKYNIPINNNCYYLKY